METPRGVAVPFGRYLFVAHDVRGYSRLASPHQQQVQDDLSELVARAAARSGLRRDLWHRQSRGDGEVAALPAEEPEMRVLDDYPRNLGHAIRLHNENRRADRRLRVRVAMHHGPAEGAAMGFSGPSIVAVCRLVDSDAAHEALSMAEGDLITIVSSSLFEQTIGQGLSTIQASRFTRVNVSSKEYREWAYVYCPLESVQSDSISSGAKSHPANEKSSVDEGESSGGPSLAPPESDGQRHSMVVNTQIKKMRVEKAVFGFEADHQ